MFTLVHGNACLHAFVNSVVIEFTSIYIHEECCGDDSSTLFLFPDITSHTGCISHASGEGLQVPSESLPQ